MAQYNLVVTSDLLSPKSVIFRDNPPPVEWWHPKNQVDIKPTEDPHSKDFACQLLEAQLCLEDGDNVTKQLVTKLFHLYRRAIQHYNNCNTRREEYFQKKLQTLTSNPLVLGALHQSQEAATQTFYKKRQFQRLIEIDQKKSVSARQIVQSVSEVERKIETTLKMQMDSITQRVIGRKLLRKSFQGDLDSDPKDVPTITRKKLFKTMIDMSSTQSENQSKFFVQNKMVRSHQS